MARKKKKHPKIKNFTRKNYSGEEVKVTTYHLSNGNLHRMDGPAKIEIVPKYDWKEVDGNRNSQKVYSHTEENHWWYRNGRLHRIDGPAIYSLNVPKDKRYGGFGMKRSDWNRYYFKGKEIRGKEEVAKFLRNGKIKNLLKDD